MPSGIQRQWNIAVAYKEQTDLDVFATGGGGSLLPLNTGNGNLSMTPIPSLQIRHDGLAVRGRHGTHQTKGDYKGELQFANYDPIFEAVMRGVWTAGGSLGGDILVCPLAGALQRRYFTVEEYEIDIAASEAYYNCAWSSFDLIMKPNGMIDCNTMWVGTGRTTGQDATSASAAPLLTAPVYPLDNVIPMASIDAVVELTGASGALEAQLDITAFNVKVDLGCVAPPVCASQYSPDVFDGVMKVGGSLTVMRRDLVPYQQALDEVSITMSATMTVPDGSQILKITVPFLTYQNAMKSDYKRDGGPLTVKLDFPEALVGIDVRGGTNPPTMVIFERN